MPHMVIANRLRDGRVVFLDPAGHWVDSIDRGALWEPAASAAALERARQDETDGVVVDPTLIDVEITNQVRRPVAIREAIRAFGPSVGIDPLAGGR